MIQHYDLRDFKAPDFCTSPSPAYGSPPFVPQNCCRGPWYSGKGDVIILARGDWRWDSSEEFASNEAAVDDSDLVPCRRFCPHVERHRTQGSHSPHRVVFDDVPCSKEWGQEMSSCVAAWCIRCVSLGTCLMNFRLRSKVLRRPSTSTLQRCLAWKQSLVISSTLIPST